MRKTILLMFLWLAGFVGIQSAQAGNEIYAVLSANKKTLTIRYDENRSANKGVTDWSVYNILNDKSCVVQNVVIDASMQHAKPETTANWFKYFTSLEEIEGLQYLNTQEVTDMSNMFADTHLKRLDLSTFNTKKVTNMANLFSQCSRLTYVNLKGWSTTWVTDMSCMFSGCQALKYVDLSSFKTPNVTDMSMMFFDSGFETLDLSNLDVSNVTKMLMMFAGSVNLQRIYAKDWTEGKGSDMSMLMFLGCYSLSGNMGTAYDESKVDITYARVDAGDKHGYFSMASTLYGRKDNTEGTEITFYYDSFAGFFRNFRPEESKEDKENVQIVHFDKSVRFAREMSTAHFFDGFTNLETIEHLDYLNTENVTDMSYMFANCPKLKSIDIDHMTTENVTNMSHMFAGCSSLHSLDVSGFELVNTTDVSSMFEGDSKLKTIYCNCSWASYDGLTSSANMFLGCTALTNGTTSYDASHVNKNYARPKGGYFTGKDELYGAFSVDGSQFILRYDQSRGNVKGVVNWDKHLYPDVRQVVIDESVQAARPTSTHNWFSAFRGMRSIKGLSNLNTSEVTDMSYMFASCGLLKSVDVSGFDMNKVTNIAHMFDCCSSLRTIYSKADWSWLSGRSEYMFLGCNDLWGGSYTKYNRDHVDKAYAHLDGGKDNPGYFTAPIELYGVLGKDKKTVTLYYDSHCEKNGGATNWMGTFVKGEIEKIILDPSVSSMALKDLSYMFFDLKNLKEIEGLQNLNTSICANMNYMFAGCSSLKRLDISTFNIKSLTSTTGMFANCSQLERIYCVEDWSASENLTESDYMFEGCTSLKGSDGTELDADHLDKSYARIGDGVQPGYFHNPPAIYGATSEEGKVFTLYCDDQMTARSGMTDWISADMSDVEKIVIDASMQKARPTSTQKWFRYFSSARRIEGIENLNTSEVTDMSYMFSNCHALECLDLNGFKMTNVTDFSGMFEECHNLERIFCDQSWNKIVGEFPFYGCKKLEGNVSGAKCKGDATDTSNGYAKVGDAENPGYFSLYENEPTEIYGLLSEDAKTLTIQYDNRRFINDGKLDWSIWNSAKGYEVEEIVLDPSMSDAKPTSMEAWFNYFQHATTITGLNGLNTSEVTDMSSLFSNCEGLTSLSLPNFNTSKVTDMSLMFYECTGLTELDLHSFITTNVTDMQMMFSACTGLKKLDLNSFITSNVTNMMMMFGGCSELTTIICTSDWYNSSCMSDWMFFGCEKLVGEMGTTYDEEKIDGTYAHVDGEGGLPGYFTTPNPPTYFTVLFEDYDGTLLKEMHVAQGKDAIPPVHPTRDGYTFSGWDTEYENVQSDMIVTAQYVLNATYTVTASSSDDALGEVTLTFDDKYIISKGEEPNSFTVIENAKGHLVATPKDKYSDFVMWNDEAEGFDQAERDITVTGDFDYVATFKKDSFNVVVTVNGIDPELVEITGAGKYGRGDNVTLTYTLNDEHYDFEDWRFDENKFVEEATLVFEEISSDHDVQIVFKAKFYTVSATVIPAEGGIVKGQGDYQYGSTYTLTLEPAEGWELKEWRDGEPLEEQSNELSGVVNGDITIECVLQQKTVTYTVTFYDWNGDLLFTEPVEEGKDAKGPDTDPEREGYKFVGWSKPITNITSDLVVIAQYEKSGTGVLEVQGDNVQSRKVLREGVLYIMYKGAMYDARGKRIDN